MSKDPDPWPKGRFLLDRARVGDGFGYTNVPEIGMHAEPMCLDEQEWKDHVAKDAKARRAAREAGVELELKLLSQEERIAKAMAEAKAKRRDVSGELFVLRRMQERGKSAVVVEKRLQRLERLVYLNRAA